MAVNVQKIMTRDPAFCRTWETMDQAASRMWERDCGALPVIDRNERLAGMITDRDMCMAAFIQGKPLAQIRVDTAMSREVFTIRDDETVEEAEHIMKRRQVRRLPVVNQAGDLVGVLSLSDLARHASGRGWRGGISEREVAATLRAVCEPRPPEPTGLAASG